MQNVFALCALNNPKQRIQKLHRLINNFPARTQRRLIPAGQVKMVEEQTADGDAEHSRDEKQKQHLESDQSVAKLVVPPQHHKVR